MPYVHHCVFCGWSRPAESATLLAPACEACGCTLRATTPEELRRAGDDAHADDFVPPTRSRDVTALFAGLVAIPMMLPVIGIQIGDLAFLVPFALTLFAAGRCWAAAGRNPQRRGPWLTLCLCAGLVAAASALAVATAVAGSGSQAAFYVGAAGSAALLVALAGLARHAIVGVRMERVVDAILLALLVAAVGTWFVAMPGFTRSNAVLTAVFLLDLLALIVAVVAALAHDAPRSRRVGWALVTATVAAAGGDALVALGLGGPVTALLWGAAGFFIALAADGDTAQDGDERTETATVRRWLLGRVVLPLLAVLTFPAITLGLWLGGVLRPAALAFFGAFFLVELVLVFGRQAWLLVDNRRAVTRERRLRADAMRRNEELEALTGLATTMTQTLEEAPIIEQALGVLHLAARADGSALHTDGDDAPELRAAAGAWQAEQAWAAGLGAPAEDREVVHRGGRQVVRIVLRARGNRIGHVTLVRGAGDPFQSRQLDLLALLVDELAVALQNARDYREKLELAIRDPLTGLYNRRFFFEALDKEVHRTERYGSPVSLAVFDVDGFKLINDRHGHATGDDVLRTIGRIAEGLVRPTDSFARIGGEEFALLMPETGQLDGLLVAERLRTAIARHSILPGRRVTVSGGVATCPQDATAREELERRADAALYWAKGHGKDMCAVASEVVVDDGTTEREGSIAHLYALVSTIDDSHLHTRDHSENVAAYAVALAQALGLDRERVVALRRAALLHDIGKVAVGEGILTKPGKLTDAEYDEIKLHPAVGATMLQHAGLSREAAWVRHHHERLDGAGYPDRLAGGEIPLEARIIFVADSFEAMTSDRPYRAGMDVADAVAELRRCSGTQFEPRLVDALTHLVEAGELTVLALREPGAQLG
jgi:diguanylate cyclase (GGDEF)-like protein/putative nucleotidyltransferase with HDIG domain